MTRQAAIEGWFTMGEEPSLLGLRCPECGTYVFPPRAAACPNPDCTATELDPVELSRTGTVWSYTVNRYAPPEPYAMKWIDPGMAKRFPYHAFLGNTLWNLVSEYKIGTRRKPEEITYVRAAYDGEVLYTDTQVGRLLSYVRATGLDRNTVVVFVADHGDDRAPFPGFQNQLVLSTPEGKLVNATAKRSGKTRTRSLTTTSPRSVGWKRF